MNCFHLGAAVNAAAVRSWWEQTENAELSLGSHVLMVLTVWGLGVTRVFLRCSFTVFTEAGALSHTQSSMPPDLSSQYVVEILSQHLRLKLQMDHHVHLAFMWVLGIQILVLVCVCQIL